MATEDNALTRPAVEALSPLTGDGEPLAPLDEVPLELEVRLGRARVPLGELRRLRPGTVLTLDRLAEEDAEVLLGGKVVARGQVVVVGQELGVRVTQLSASRGQR